MASWLPAWMTDDGLTDACELGVQPNSQEHKKEQNGPQGRNGKLGESIRVRDES